MKIDELNNRIHLGNSGTSPVQNPTVNIPGMPNIYAPISPTVPNPAPLSKSPYSASDPIMPSDLFEQALKDNSKQALRYNQGKVNWSLVDFKSLEPMVDVLAYGTKKYSRDNWRLGMPATQIIESMLRHTFSLLNGEFIDNESLCYHVGHIQCNAMFLAYVLAEKPEFNDLRKD